jgi:hypothetical protein
VGREYSEALRSDVDALLREGYRLWEETELPPLGPGERYAAADAAGAAYSGPHARAFAAACQCFYLFRALHRLSEAFPASATLLGDWFFSQFSLQLIPLDNVPLLMAFSDFLARDAVADGSAGCKAGRREGDNADCDTRDPLAFMPSVLRALRI